MRGGVECDAGFARAAAAEPRVCGGEGQCDAESVWDGEGAYGGVADRGVLMWEEAGSVYKCMGLRDYDQLAIGPWPARI